jgi:hypothetical protein
MTHDELLADINKLTVVEGIFMKDALKAVVELHKPKLWQGIEMVCEGCGTDIKQNYNSAYPCPTIQAIEKELA